MNLKRGSLWSALSIIFSLLSLVITPALVFVSYAIVGESKALGRVEVDPLDIVQSSLRLAPIIYSFLLLAGLICGILGALSKPRKRVTIFASASGIMIAVLSLLLFWRYMFQTLGST